MTYNIGIAITTRNRPDILRMCLSNMKKFGPPGAKIIVIDDASEDPDYHRNAEGFTYLKNKTRKGIAATKNRCLWELRDCEYIFLFDDDTWPIQDGWWKPYIEVSRATGIQHMNFLNKSMHNPIQGYCEEGYILYSFADVSGVMLFLTNKVLDKVGGMNPKYKIYGNEHVGYSIRIYRAGLTNGYGAYIHIEETESMIRCLDYEAALTGKKKLEETEKAAKLDGGISFRSSVADENRQSMVDENNTPFMEDIRGAIYIPLEPYND